MADANNFLGFPRGRAQSLRLYKNDKLLSKDGQAAFVRGQPASFWQALSGPQTLILGVDGTPDVTYTFVDQDFIDAGTGYTSIGRNSLAAWEAVFAFKVPGITPSIELGALVLTSNLGTSSKARVKISGGTLVTNGVFALGIAQGKDKDYVLDRNVSEVLLSTPLAEGDKLTAGTEFTRAFLETPAISPTTLAAQATVWLGVDGGATEIRQGASSAAPIAISVPSDGLKFWGHRLRLTTTVGAFSNVGRNDVAILWDSAFSADLFGDWRVSRVATDGSYFELDHRAMNSFRSEHTQTVLANGKILVAGGWAGAQVTGATKSCEIFDPATNTWSATGEMTQPRAGHRAVLLADGRVFVFGGTTGINIYVAAGEIYDPATGLWTAASTTGQPSARAWFGMDLGADNKVYLCGGRVTGGADSADVFCYNPGANTWTTLSSLGLARSFHTFNRLSDAKIYAIGGVSGGVPTATGEAYTPGTDTWAGSGSLQSARYSHTATILDDGRLFLVGGFTAPNTPSTKTDFFTAGGAFANGPNLNNARAAHGAALMASGKVVVGFGATGASTPLVEIWDSGTNLWSASAAPSGAYPRVWGGASALSSSRCLFAGGRGTDTNSLPRASAEIYSQVGNTWAIPEPNINGTLNLATSGITVTRLAGRPLRVQLASGNNYTADSFSDALQLPAALDRGLRGVSVGTYRTTRLRLTTNTFAASPTSWSGFSGDLAVLAADTAGQLLGLPRGTLTTNLDGHLGSVESGNPDTGTCEFTLPTVRGANAAARPQVHWFGSSDGITLASLPSSGHQVVGLSAIQDSFAQTRAGNNQAFVSPIQTQAYDGLARGLDYLTLRRGPEEGWIPGDRLYFAAPYALGPYDSLIAVADGDPLSKQFSNNMYRTLKPVGNTYAAQNEFQDGAGAPTSLAVAFGLAYDFSDFAIHMRARVKTHDADNSKRVLWRWWRLGPDGQNAQIQYALPLGPTLPVAVDVDDDSARTTLVRVRLAGGALKVGASLRAATKIGVAAPSASSGMTAVVYALGLAISSATRAANVTVLTLTLPAGVTDHGINVSDSIWVQSSDPNFTTGLYSVTARSVTTVSYTETAADQGATANIGTLSRDTAEATMSGLSPSLANGDFFRLEGTSGVAAAYEGQTIRITASGNQYVSGKFENFQGGTTATLTWYTLTDVSAWKVFANPQQSATTIVTAVNALYAAGAGAAPVFGTVIGTGAGLIDRSSSEEAGAANSVFSLTDGQNFVATQVNPATTADNYQLAFKDSVTAGLGSNSDWANEEVRLVPLTSRSISSWLMQPAVSGLFTALKAEPSSRGRKVQLRTLTAGSDGRVEVQGGTANLWTATVRGAGASVGGGNLLVEIPRADAPGIKCGDWVAIDNTAVVPKAVFDANTRLNSLTTGGVFTFDSGGTKVWDRAAAPANNTAMLVERQGRFVCYQDTGQGITPILNNIVEGDWLVVTRPASPTPGVPQVADANVGTFRIVRVVAGNEDGTGGALWVENNIGIGAATCEMDLAFIKADSVMPGDTIHISTNLWGAANKGNWKVTSVGDAGAGAFSNFYTFKVDVTSKAPVPVNPAVNLGGDAALVQALDSAPARYIKRVVNVVPDQNDLTLVRVKFESNYGWRAIGQVAGSVLTALDKLSFPIGPANGADGYKFNTGLIQEVNKVVYGDPNDPATYPGVAAAGARINHEGPLVKRATFSILVRLRSGYPREDAEAAIRSAIASKFNQQKLDTPLAISDILSAAQAVVGVESVVPLVSYGSGNDLIAVQPHEKLLVQDLDNDIQVSFVGA